MAVGFFFQYFFLNGRTFTPPPLSLNKKKLPLEQSQENIKKRKYVHRYFYLGFCHRCLCITFIVALEILKLVLGFSIIRMRRTLSKLNFFCLILSFFSAKNIGQKIFPRGLSFPIPANRQFFLPFFNKNYRLIFPSLLLLFDDVSG